MSYIQLDKIIKEKNTLKYDFHVSDDLKKYFSGEQFFIEYPENIENLPDCVAAVPFCANVLPITFLTHADLNVPEIDEWFINCIPKIRRSYSFMFNGADFSGNFNADKITDPRRGRAVPEKAAMLYSGGADSALTLINHIDEKPNLISIWGSDIGYDDKESWDNLHDNYILPVAQMFSLKNFVVRSNFRSFDNEKALTGGGFRDVVPGGYWHDLKHGLALLGQTAPVCYLNKITSLYISSSFSWDDKKVHIASHATVDSYVRFSGCKVFHDAAEYDRQEKLDRLVEFCHENDVKMPLHVCFGISNGDNCCKCEKCYRTILKIYLAGGDPRDFSFNVDETILKDIENYVRENAFALKSYPNIAPYWTTEITDHIKEKRDTLKTKPYYKDLLWCFNIDNIMRNAKSPNSTFISRTREELSRLTFYQNLHDKKEELSTTLKEHKKAGVKQS